MSETKKEPTSAWLKRIDPLLQSQLFLGSLVGLLTIANGFGAFRSTRASLTSTTVDFWASRAMQKASISHLTGNAKAGLVQERNTLRQVFAVAAMVSLVIGLVVVFWAS
jgi:hypothetical protein